MPLYFTHFSNIFLLLPLLHFRKGQKKKEFSALKESSTTCGRTEKKNYYRTEREMKWVAIVHWHSIPIVLCVCLRCVHSLSFVCASCIHFACFVFRVCFFFYFSFPLFLFRLSALYVFTSNCGWRCFFAYFVVVVVAVAACRLSFLFRFQSVLLLLCFVVVVTALLYCLSLLLGFVDDGTECIKYELRLCRFHTVAVFVAHNRCCWLLRLL